jgi:hypothetical protein
MCVANPAIRVGGGVDLVGAAMNVTRHDDRRSSLLLSKLYFFDAYYNDLGSPL